MAHNGVCRTFIIRDSCVITANIVSITIDPNRGAYLWVLSLSNVLLFYDQSYEIDQVIDQVIALFLKELKSVAFNEWTSFPLLTLIVTKNLARLRRAFSENCDENISAPLITELSFEKLES